MQLLTGERRRRATYLTGKRTWCTPQDVVARTSGGWHTTSARSGHVIRRIRQPQCPPLAAAISSRHERRREERKMLSHRAGRSLCLSTLSGLICQRFSGEISWPTPLRPVRIDLLTMASIILAKSPCYYHHYTVTLSYDHKLTSSDTSPSATPPSTSPGVVLRALAQSPAASRAQQTTTGSAN